MPRLASSLTMHTREYPDVTLPHQWFSNGIDGIAQSWDYILLTILLLGREKFLFKTSMQHMQQFMTVVLLGGNDPAMSLNSLKQLKWWFRSIAGLPIQICKLTTSSFLWPPLVHPETSDELSRTQTYMPKHLTGFPAQCHLHPPSFVFSFGTSATDVCCCMVPELAARHSWNICFLGLGDLVGYLMEKNQVKMEWRYFDLSMKL